VAVLCLTIQSHSFPEELEVNNDIPAEIVSLVILCAE